MSFYSEPDGSCGERGEWAHMGDAYKVKKWRSWRGAALMIGPVKIAFVGPSPMPDRLAVFKQSSDIICSEIGPEQRYRIGTDDEHRLGTYGVEVYDPLVFDHASGAFSRLYREKGGESVEELWIPSAEARCVRAVRQTLPYIDLVGNLHQVPADSLSDTR